MTVQGPSGPPGRPGARPAPDPGDAPAARPGPGAGVLADRIAATLASHEPGWRLPRPSELARRHHVSAEEAAAAVDYLVARRLVRWSPEGRLYRTGPADCLISLENLAGPGITVDPMDHDLTCLSYAAEQRPAPEDTARALGIHGGEPVGVLLLAWALDGSPAAMSTTYLAAGLPGPRAMAGWVRAAAEQGELPMRPPPAGSNGDHPHLRPGTALCALTVQMDLPPASAARRLRLAPGQMAVLVTARFGERPGHYPAALTDAVLRPDMFRITLDTPAAEAGGQHARAAWSLASADPDL